MYSETESSDGSDWSRSQDEGGDALKYEVTAMITTMTAQDSDNDLDATKVTKQENTGYQVLIFNRNLINLWHKKQIYFFKIAMETYGTVFPRAKFCPHIFRQISQDYFMLITNQSAKQFQTSYPINSLWRNAGFET